MTTVKILANYLPQFHSIPENDAWWGKNYTDWVAVKKSKSLFKNHEQPNIPLDNNYYDLSMADSIKWQAELAVRYGIYGFAIYHYWFNSNMHLLEKPAEIILSNEDIKINICFIWDNCSWKRTWGNIKFGNDWGNQNLNNDVHNSNEGILAKLTYGNKYDWQKHFDYLLPFFKDDRYIKVNNSPVFGIFNQDNEPEKLTKMIAYWDMLAKANGFAGIYILGKRNHHGIAITNHQYDYEPLKHGWLHESFGGKVYQKMKNVLYQKANHVDKYDYDMIWKRIIKDAERNMDETLMYGSFVSYDDTPRRGKKGKVVLGGSPKKFELYMKKLIDISDKQNKEFVILTAWNEWGEGAYLEPDIKNKYAYLEALKRCLK